MPPTIDMICHWLRGDTETALGNLAKHKDCHVTIKAAHHHEKMGKRRKRLQAQLIAWLNAPR